MLCGWRNVEELSDGDGGEFSRLCGWRDVGELSDGDGGEFSRLCGWRDIGEGDVKIFLDHLITMGLVQKGNLEKYGQAFCTKL